MNLYLKAEKLDDIESVVANKEQQRLQDLLIFITEYTNEESNILPNPDGPTPLDQYLNLLKDQYEDVYAQVLISTNKKYVERVFALKETLEEDYNISFKTIKN